MTDLVTQLQDHVDFLVWQTPTRTHRHASTHRHELVHLFEQCHVIYAQVNALTQNPAIPDLPFDDQPEGSEKRAEFARFVQQLDIPHMSKTVFDTVRTIDALADSLQPLTPQSKSQQMARLKELEAENAELGAQLEQLTAQAEVTYSKITELMQTVADDRLAALQAAPVPPQQ